MVEAVKTGCMYVAQFVEYDICVQAPTIKELKERLVKTLVGHIAIAEKCGMKPFECVAAGNAAPADQPGIVERFPVGAHELTLQIA